MEETFKIVQQINSVRRGFRETVFNGQIERIARLEFNRLKEDWPEEYFELLKIEHRETCLEFTPKI